MLEVIDLRTSLFGPVSLSVAAGECVAIMGASGSGKSLFLRALADLDPNEGRVLLGDEDRDAMPADRWRRKVAMVPAESGWWSDRVADHFEPGAVAGVLLEAFGLPDAMAWEVSRLSSGERHRLALARALALKPAAILLDEPTATLDEAATAQVEAVLRDELARGVPVVLVTHDPAQAKRMGSRLLTMERGRLHARAEARA
ncbi:ATP-binding cassette domain-containing protein [Limibaculum sp. M0105]|uniref:ATP-binding cassette domain-containing protein n=2 Tax=Thermohalobaculum xanthum TaxID=2753746 RepID=A0A8J7MA14_9RHOB|nr:ATP-binding cassette domain-containing protein [Thermohalobaculum xanthum]